LFTLIWVNHKYYFVMTHYRSLRINQLSVGATANPLKARNMKIGG
jgi:hypothetical protein